MPRKSPNPDAAVFNLDDFGFAAEDTDEREIELPHGKTLHVTLARLNGRQVKKIPLGMRVKMEDMYRAAAHHVLDWDFAPVNKTTGKPQPLPAPGAPDAAEKYGEGNEWAVLELLDNESGAKLIGWLINPSGQLFQGEQGKKSSTPLKPGDTPTDSDATAAT